MNFTPLARFQNERDVEIPWTLANVTCGPVLDVGCHDSTYLADLPGPVDGIDVRPTHNPALRDTYCADIRTWDCGNKYPFVLAVSTVEHIGLAFEPYGTEADDPDGDIHAIAGMRRALAPGGTLLVTVPFGTPEHRGWYRRYDHTGLCRLMEGLDWSAEYYHDPTWEVGGVALITACL